MATDSRRYTGLFLRSGGNLPPPSPLVLGTVATDSRRYTGVFLRSGGNLPPQIAEQEAFVWIKGSAEKQTACKHMIMLPMVFIF